MHIAILATGWIRKSIEEIAIPPFIHIIWVEDIAALSKVNADIYMDGLYEIEDGHEPFLQFIQHKPIWVSSILKTSTDIPFPCIRFNGWSTLFNPKNIEIATPEQFKNHITDITKLLNWNYTLVPDVSGMVTPKVVSMIINEAYYAAEENVSTKGDIDIAMKLGTNYPYGPFEWAERIGLEHIYKLLKNLSISDKRVVVAKALEVEWLKCL